MSFTFKKYVPFLCIIYAFFITQCAQPASSDENANVHTEIKEAVDSLPKNHSTQAQQNSESSIKKLPTWPLKAKIVKGKRYPFDNAPEDASFVVFREKLFQSVIEKDLVFLTSIIHDDIKFSFGAENGKEDFLKTWQLDANPENSLFWSEMTEVLMLGGGFLTFNRTSFFAPYIFVLEDIEDPYSQAVIVGNNVRLRAQPYSQGKIIGSLDWDLVEVIYEEGSIEEIINGETHFWQKVETASGQKGYVYSKYIRSPIDFRAGFSQYNGKWMMDLFIAGD